MTTADTRLQFDLTRLLISGQLPALPQSAIRILALAKDPENGSAEFAVPIEADPGLTSQVLRFVNSSYFGFSREISSVKHALTLVGIRTIKNFTLWSAVFNLMPNPKCGSFDLRSLWQDSLRRALFARMVGLALGLRDADEAFAAALLQDMAVPLLAKESPEAYGELFDQRAGGLLRLSDIERARFGWTHADVAAAIARHWDLPEELAEPIQQHTHLEELAAGAGASSTRLAVALSSLLPATVDATWPEREQLEQYYERLLPSCAPALQDILAQVDQDFLEFSPVLQIKAPTRSLVELYADTSGVDG